MGTFLFSFLFFLFFSLGFSDTGQDINVPVNVKVALLGFENTSLIDSKRLHDLLLYTFNHRDPIILGERKERVGVIYKIEYEVFHLSQYLISKIETTIRENLVLMSDKSKQSGTAIYEVETISLQNVFEEIIGSLGDPLTISMRDPDGPHNIKNEYVFFLINPNKANILPEKNGNFEYAYKSGKGGGRSSSWVGFSRFCVEDISAKNEEIFMKVQLAKQSLIHHLEHPDKTQRSDIFLHQTVNIIRSAIEQVFIPNLAFEANMKSEIIFVPILVMRNHNLFHPFESGDYSIDLQKIKNQITQTLLPNQKIVFFRGVHFLHDHPQVSIALQKSTKQYFGSNGDERFISSEELIHELGNAEDLITSGFQSDSNFQKIDINFQELTQSVSSSLKKKLNFIRSKGVKVLPIFVFSLVGKSRLLLDGTSFVKANKDGVIVLQTSEEEVETPFYTAERSILIDPRDPTCKIISGVLEAIGGVPSVISRQSSLRNDSHLDFTWAIGYHPYGYFGDCASLSSVFYDLPVRNHVISRIHMSREIYFKLESHIQHFFSNILGVKDKTSLDGFLSAIQYSHDYGLPPFVINKLLSLDMSLKNARKRFSDVADLIKNGKIKSAYLRSVQLLESFQSMDRFVERELEDLRKELECCEKVEHSRKHDGLTSNLIKNMLITMLKFFLVVVIVYWVFTI